MWLAGKRAVVLFENGRVLMAHRTQAVGIGAITFEMGTARAEFIDHMDQVFTQTPRTEFLRGMKFTGQDREVLQFDGRFGLSIGSDGIAFVAKPADE